MIRILLADNQVIFRAGAARVLAKETDVQLMLQCEDAARLESALETVSGVVVIFASSLGAEPVQLLERIRATKSRSIMILENGERIAPNVAAMVDCAVTRSVTGPELMDCVRAVARGERYMSAAMGVTEQATVATRVRERLTPKEFQIVGLIVEGCKNKEIAIRLGTKEQVIKNYLRSIYDKTGVSDRLELALFTIHHRLLEAA